MNFIGIIIGFLIYSKTNNILFAVIAYWLTSLVIKQFSENNQQEKNRRRQYTNTDFQQEFQRQYQQQNSNYYRQQISKHDFATALLVLSAAVMKSDGNPLKSELIYVKQFFSQQFSSQFAQKQMLAFRDVLKKDFDLQKVCSLIKQAQPQQQRSVLVQYLFGIALANGHVSEEEVRTINQISILLGISNYEFEQIKAMFYKNTSNAYKVLGIEKSATDSEIKKAYRKMAVKHHPDKFAQMGEEYQKAAKEKFQKIQEAYENIKKERKIK